MIGRTKSKPEPVVNARVRRADGRIVDLGRVNGRFPWRAWLYRLRCLIERRK